jgi:hypothetical protein
MACTLISIVVKLKAAKMVTKSRGHRGEPASGWKKEDVVAPTLHCQ